MIFWIVISLLGLFGGLADIVLNQWSKTMSLQWWTASAGMFLAFMTGLGMAMRLANAKGYSLTAVVLLVLLANIMAVGLWDFVIGATRFTHLQWLGAILAVTAMVLFELGKK